MLFADDCVCYREIKGTEDTVKLQEDIDHLGCWARKWGMRFNQSNAIQITRKRSMHPIIKRELVRPVLEYGVQFGTPQVYLFKKNLRRYRQGQLDL